MAQAKFLFFPCHKARPDQAGFWRRFSAFAIDSIIIIIFTFLVYVAYVEIAAAVKREPGIVAQAVRAMREGGPFLITTESERDLDKYLKNAYLQELEKSLPPEKYEQAKEMTFWGMSRAFPLGGRLENLEEKIIMVGEGFNILREVVVAYLYFGFFFRFGGQTPGKRLLRLKVVDLSGKSRLGCYQCFERAHGYAASAVVASLSFLQVLWDAEGLAL